MQRRTVIGFAIGVGAVGAALLSRRRLATPAPAPATQQWPFDQHELRALMDRVITTQRAYIQTVDTAPQRARAQAFLDYYEQRRAAAPRVVSVDFCK